MDLNAIRLLVSSRSFLQTRSTLKNPLFAALRPINSVRDCSERRRADDGSNIVGARLKAPTGHRTERAVAAACSSQNMADGESNSLVHNQSAGEMTEEPREPLLKKQILEQKLGPVDAAVDAAMDALGNPLGNGAGRVQSLRVKRLAPEAVLPARGSASAAGYDLSSAYAAVVPARGKALVKTELSIAIPEGTYARVAPRSGLAWKHSIDVGAGVIDFDYRGPVGVILFNHAETDFSIKPGDRIAQLILEKISTPSVEEVDDLDATVRGVGGFGSTGIAVAAVAVEGA